MALTYPLLVTVPNGSFGMVTAGPESFDLCSRERRDRLRSAWLRCGWDWPSDVRLAAPHQAIFDLPAAAAVFLAYNAPAQAGAWDHVYRWASVARFVGVVNLDGRVLDGVVLAPGTGADGARQIEALSDLPAALAWLAGSFSCPEEGP